MDWSLLIANFIGGLALFLFGMGEMSDALKKSAGNRMRIILSRLTGNRFIGLFVGFFVTVVMQSSSATTVMLVGFVHSGLMTFAQSFGIILGSNIGSTVTAQLIAFNITDYALPVVALGFAISMFSRRERLRGIGKILLGFGLLFYGMALMSDAMSPLRTYPEFINLLKTLDNPYTAILAGFIFTALIQSSGAFSGIVIILAQQQLISPEAGIALIIGSNIGTTSTAWLATANASREAIRVAVAHTIFNVSGVLIFMFWIPQFSEIVKLTSADPARQIANAHTFFNLAMALLYLPFTNILSRLILRMVKNKTKRNEHLVTKFINKHSLHTPEPAIDLAIAEIGRTLKILSRMLEAVIIPFIQKNIPKDKYHPELDLIQGLDMREEEIDFLETEITDFIIELSRKSLDEKRMIEIFGLLSVINDIESTADIIHKDMIPMIAQKQAMNTDFSDEGKAEIISYHEKMMKQLSRLRDTFEFKDSVKAVNVLVKSEGYDNLEHVYMHRHFTRIHHEQSQTIYTHRLHSDLFDALKRISMYLENIAKTVAQTSPFK